MSAETAPSNIQDHHTRPHLHIVESSDEHGPEDGVDVMVGFEPNVRRDYVAIQKFISKKDELLAKGVSFDNAILDAARSYDETLSVPEEQWRPKIVNGSTDFNPGRTSGNYTLKGGVTLLENQSSVNLLSAVRTARESALQAVHDRYEALKIAGHDTFAERNAEAAEIADVNKKYRDPVSSKAHTVTDTEDYTSAATGETRASTIEDRDILIKDQLDSADAAIEASYKVRQNALAEGKTVDQAYDLGATEYKRVMDANGNKTTPAGRREASAIQAFNEEMRAFVSGDQHNSKFGHAKALHRATGKYFETLKEVAHMGHSDPTSAYADNHHNEHDNPTNPPTPPEPEVDPEKKKESNKKIRKLFGKIGYVIRREHRVLTSREFDQSKKSTAAMGDYAMDGDDYALSLSESIGDALNRKSSQFGRFKDRVLEKLGNTPIPRRFKAWRAEAETRKEHRRTKKEQLDHDVARRIDTIRESKWRRDGKDIIKDIRDYSKEQAREKARAAERIAKKQSETEVNEEDGDQ